jgi:hypothetical protein
VKRIRGGAVAGLGKLKPYPASLEKKHPARAGMKTLKKMA